MYMHVHEASLFLEQPTTPNNNNQLVASEMINVAKNIPSPCAPHLASRHTVASIVHVPYHRWRPYDDWLGYDNFGMNDSYVVWLTNVVYDGFVDWCDSVVTVVSNAIVDWQHFDHCSEHGCDGNGGGARDRGPRDGTRDDVVETGAGVGAGAGIGVGDDGHDESHATIDDGPHRRHCDRCRCEDDTTHTMTTM